MRVEVEVNGSGHVTLPAYGVADAEHQVEKEMRAAWPGARVNVLEVARLSPEPRIVEEFAVLYRVRGTVAVEVERLEDGRRAALRLLNERMASTRFARITWDPVDRQEG
jgi:hypothetical protein